MKQERSATAQIIIASLLLSGCIEEPPTIRQCVEHRTETRQVAIPRAAVPCPSVGIINTCGGINIGPINYRTETSQVCVREETAPNPRYRPKEHS